MLKAIDTHAHLDFPQFDGDRNALISELEREQVGVINIATSHDSFEPVVELTKHKLIWAALGLHPTDINSDTLTRLPQILDQIKSLSADNSKVVAIGEVGLDYYRDQSRETANRQQTALREFLTLAQELDLPVIFHCRNAYGDLLTILADYPNIRGVVHCFTGNSEEAQRFISQGLFVSFTATVTYPQNTELGDTVETVPLEKILLETDCPFLPPHDRRGQRNDPRSVFLVAEKIAELKKISSDEIMSRTTENAVKLFKLGEN